MAGGGQAAAQFAEPTEGTSGSASPAGSMTANGMAAALSRRLMSPGSEEQTSTTPSGLRRSTPGSHSGAGVCRVPLSVSTTVARFSLATFSTPRISSIAQMLSSSWNTMSMSGERDDGWARLRYPWTSSRRTTLARVARETSVRPLSTFETVGIETPASFATLARVTLPPPVSSSSCIHAGHGPARDNSLGE